MNTAQKAKNRGNAAVKSKDFKAAVEAYTEALAVDSQSAAMAGVLHSNRAAAYQGLGDVALALADCCRAKALAPGFAKVGLPAILLSIYIEKGFFSTTLLS